MSEERFATPPRPRRETTVSVRLTTAQAELLDELVERLKVRGKSDVLRRALDYFLEHAPEAQPPPAGRSRRK